MGRVGVEWGGWEWDRVGVEWGGWEWEVVCETRDMPSGTGIGW